jgi:hypothetical protein
MHEMSEMQEALSTMSKMANFASGPAGGIVNRVQPVDVVKTVDGGVKFVAYCGRGLGATEHALFIPRSNLLKMSAQLIQVFVLGEAKPLVRSVKHLKRLVS